jgi:hypothetical protein
MQVFIKTAFSSVRILVFFNRREVLIPPIPPFGRKLIFPGFYTFWEYFFPQSTAEKRKKEYVILSDRVISSSNAIR